MNKLPRPDYGQMTLARALDYDWRGYDLTLKCDGRWHEFHIGRSTIIGELMPDHSFFAFELPIYDGRDLRHRPRFERMEILDTFHLRRPQSPARGESPAHFIQRVLDSGGEGIVAASHDGFFGVDICKVKRSETHDCLILEKHPAKQSVHLSLNGEDVGWCPCLGKSFDLVKAGDVAEVTAYGRHASGKFREARFLRVRLDKAIL
jgi:ATP-dependent DNA ligase